MLLYPEESYKITGAIYEVHKELGPGLLEKGLPRSPRKGTKTSGYSF